MYELTCPNCRNPSTAPFVRAGAVALCGKCGKRYQIRSEHYKRAGAPAMASAGIGAAGAGSVLAAGAGASVAVAVEHPPVNGEARAVERVTAAVTLDMAVAPPPSGAARPGTTQEALAAAPAAPTVRSESPPVVRPTTMTMQAAPGGTAPPPAFVPPTPSTERTRRRDKLAGRALAARLARKRSVNTFVLLGGAALLVAAVLVSGYYIVGYYMMKYRSGHTPGAAATDGAGVVQAAADPGRPAPAVLDPQLPRVRNCVLTPSNWVRVDEPYFADAQDDPLVGVRAATLVEFGDDEVLFTASVVTRSVQPVSWVTVHVMLLKAEGEETRVHARADVPLALLTRATPQQIRLRIPKEVYEPGLIADAEADFDKPMAGGVLLDDVAHRLYGAGDSAAMKLTWTNSGPVVMGSLNFVLQAYDASDNLIAQWQAEWPRMVGVNQKIEFATPTPLAAAWKVDHWKIVAAGRPVK